VAEERAGGLGTDRKSWQQAWAKNGLAQALSSTTTTNGNGGLRPTKDWVVKERSADETAALEREERGVFGVAGKRHASRAAITGEVESEDALGYLHLRGRVCSDFFGPVN
jgi:hypothetical protein